MVCKKHFLYLIGTNLLIYMKILMLERIQSLCFIQKFIIISHTHIKIQVKINPKFVTDKTINNTPFIINSASIVYSIVIRLKNITRGIICILEQLLCNGRKQGQGIKGIKFVFKGNLVILPFKLKKKKNRKA